VGKLPRNDKILKNTMRKLSGLETYVKKSKGHPRTGHEGPEGSRGIALLFL
jgi:hypothetical protein